MRKTLIAAMVAAPLFTLAACGNDDDAGTPADHNDADVTFAQQMIPHHEQAIEMAELAGNLAASKAVSDLAADIEAAQGPEIDTMTGWLESWGEDVPEEEGMAGMDDADMSSGDMNGMMSDEQLAELEAATGTKFDRMFLTMMIEHHEGAIEMAQAEQAEGQNPDAKALAGDIETAQTEEIATMRELLAS